MCIAGFVLSRGTKKMKGAITHPVRFLPLPRHRHVRVGDDTIRVRD